VTFAGALSFLPCDGCEYGLCIPDDARPPDQPSVSQQEAGPLASVIPASTNAPGNPGRGHGKSAGEPLWVSSLRSGVGPTPGGRRRSRWYAGVGLLSIISPLAPHPRTQLG
jgi:hypothetical protein